MVINDHWHLAALALCLAWTEIPPSARVSTKFKQQGPVRHHWCCEVVKTFATLLNGNSSIIHFIFAKNFSCQSMSQCVIGQLSPGYSEHSFKLQGIWHFSVSCSNLHQEIIHIPSRLYLPGSNQVYHSASISGNYAGLLVFPHMHLKWPESHNLWVNVHEHLQVNIFIRSSLELNL